MKINKENCMLLDIQYVRPDRQRGTPDYLYIIWKDLLTGEKKITSVPEPTVDIYFEKPEFRNHNHNKNYARLENLDRRTVKYNNIIPEIANEMGPSGKQYLNQIYTTRDFSKLKDFQLYPYVFGSDVDIRAFNRVKWLQTLDNNTTKHITKGFFDIETDSIELNEGFSDPKTCPVDLITLIDKDAMKSYTFALVGQEHKPRNMQLLNKEQRKEEEKRIRLYRERHEQEEDLMNNIKKFKKELDEEFSEHYGHIDYNFYFYKDERKLLTHVFQLVHQLKLDFIVVWNIAFDIPYIIERLKVLGMNPEDVMCHPDFPVKTCYFKKDTKNSIPKNMSNYFNCSSYTVWYCQMILYAAIRKSQKELRSNKLTDIAKDEIKDEKLDYSEEGDIKYFSYKNYKKYVMYNIKDVLLQLGIETRTSDLNTLYTYSYQNVTPYDQVFKQTLKLRNVQYERYLQDGLVPGNNINIYNAKKQDNRVLSEDEEENNEDDVGFEGALVGNPILNDKFGMELYGEPSNSIFNYCIDMDMSAFYPHVIYTNNIDPSTLYFKCICDSKQFKPQGGKLEFNGITDTQIVPTNNDSFEGDVAKEIFDNFQTRNWLSMGHKWTNLPSVTDVYEECLKQLSA